MQWIAVSVLILIQLALVVIGDALPAAVASIVAGTIYLPLWPLSAIGIPVFLQAESGGWAKPSVLGWFAFIVIWSLLWTAVVAVLLRIRR
jgi:hypothetical protein